MEQLKVRMKAQLKVRMIDGGDDDDDDVDDASHSDYLDKKKQLSHLMILRLWRQMRRPACMSSPMGCSMHQK